MRGFWLNTMIICVYLPIEHNDYLCVSANHGVRACLQVTTGHLSVSANHQWLSVCICDVSATHGVRACLQAPTALHL